MTQKLVGGEISQLIRHETSAKVVDWGADKGRLVCSDGAEIDVLRAVSGGGDPVLEGPLGARDLLTLQASSLEWARRPIVPI